MHTTQNAIHETQSITSAKPTLSTTGYIYQYAYCLVDNCQSICWPRSLGIGKLWIGISMHRKCFRATKMLQFIKADGMTAIPDKHTNICYVCGRRAAIFSRVDLFRSGNWMSKWTIMSPRLLGSFEYGRPSPAICRTLVGLIMSCIFSATVRLLSVGTVIVTPPSNA